MGGQIRLGEVRDLIRVLVVDDDAPFRIVLKAMLEGAEGVTVVAEAGNGVQALELEAELGIDVVLLDLHMPVMGGLETVRWLRERGSRAFVIMLSGTDQPGELADALNAGADEALRKPIGVAELRAAVAWSRRQAA
jgi:CheY-like chemotaxis protein